MIVAFLPFSGPNGSANPRQSGPKDVRIKAIGNRRDARIGDDLCILTRVPYPPLGVFAHLSNVTANLGLYRVVPGERPVASPIDQLVYHSLPRSNRHSPLIWPLSEPVADYPRGGLKLRDHAFVGECQR